MTAEAALLGVPTFSCYPGEPYIIERYLIRKKLVIRETNPEKAVKRVLKTLDNVNYVKKRRSEIVKRLVETFEDPIEVIVREVEKFA